MRAMFVTTGGVISLDLVNSSYAPNVDPTTRSAMSTNVGQRRGLTMELRLGLLMRVGAALTSSVRAAVATRGEIGDEAGGAGASAADEVCFTRRSNSKSCVRLLRSFSKSFTTWYRSSESLRSAFVT